MDRRIDVIVNDGSPLGVTEKSLRGEDGRLGVGGAELALLTLCSGLQYYGNDVTLYNNPREGGVSSFAQKTLDEFNPQEDRDILIIFRSPNQRSLSAKGKKIWWSCDQYTIGDFRQFAQTVNKIVCISRFHKNYFKTMYGIENAEAIDLPVRTWEYKDKVQKIPKRCIFTSVPDRGLMPLHAAWAQIVSKVPEASLVITSDWRLWSEHADPNLLNPYRIAFAGLPNVQYKGAVKREELVQIQMEADLHLYPGTYDELFCIAVAESQVAGAFPLTSDYGALPTTNMGQTLHGIPTNPDFIQLFVDKAVELLNDPLLYERQEYVRETARNRFSLENILKQWDKVFDE